MSNDALIGCTGFIGLSLQHQHNFNYLYSSNNINQIEHKSFRYVVCAAPSAKKWYINDNPDEDLNNIENLLKNIKNIKHVAKFILISTIDVYGADQVAQSSTNESTNPIPSNMYGKNRFYFENELKSYFEDKILVLRLPALFGMGLSKNSFYDMLHNNMLDKIDPKSIFQVYNIENLWDDILNYMPYSCVNLFTKELCISDVKHLFPYNPSGPCRNVAYRAKSEIIKERNIHDDMKIWIEREMMKERLSVSQICVGKLDTKLFNTLPKSLGVNSFDYVPTMHFDWGNMIVDSNVITWHIQSVAYALNFNIGTKEFTEHYRVFTEKVVKQLKGIKTITLGCPKLRNHAVMSDIITELRNMAEMTPKNVKLCLEINPKEYGASWGHNVESVCSLVKLVDNLYVTLDIGCVMMSDTMPAIDIISNIGEKLGHVHISVPNMDIITQQSLKKHVKFVNALQHYDGDFSIEQKGSTLLELWSVINFVKDIYKPVLLKNGSVTSER